MNRPFLVTVVLLGCAALLISDSSYGGEYYDYHGCQMYCEFSGCLNAEERNFWRYCNLNHPTLPVMIPGWSMAGRNICNEPITGAWYCCRIGDAGSPGPGVGPGGSQPTPGGGGITVVAGTYGGYDYSTYSYFPGHLYYFENQSA